VCSISIVAVRPESCSGRKLADAESVAERAGRRGKLSLDEESSNLTSPIGEVKKT